MRAYSLKITLPRFTYFINLEILPVTTKIRENIAQTRPEESEVLYRQMKMEEQILQERSRIQAMLLAQSRF